jgi:soluble lytic murein transglycosylase
MIKRITALIFFTIALVFSLISLSCAGPVNNYEFSAKLSEKAFYSKPDQIIKEFVKKTDHCQNNYILAGAYKNKKELKKALLYYTNSCFDNKFNFNIRLFPDPVYLFTESTKDRSIYYNDSVYHIASIFYDYGEHDYVLKFTSLIDKDDSLLYRDSVILRSRTLVKLGRYKDAADELQKALSLYKGSDSRTLLHLRLGSVYESAGDFQEALDSYFEVIKSQSGIWQNTIAAEKILFITTEKKINLNSTDRQMLFASALYDAKDYTRALISAEEVLLKEESSDAAGLFLKIQSRLNISKAAAFLEKRKSKPGYEVLLLEHGNILWDTGKKDEAVKIYNKLISASDDDIAAGVLTRLALYYEQKDNPDFIKYMEMYVDKFPHEELSGRFIWLMGRFYIKKPDKKRAAEYFKRGIAEYPLNSYTPYCRFWLKKIDQENFTPEDNIKLLEELAVNNPDSYHTLSLLKEYADKQDISSLSQEFKNAVNRKDKNKMILFHTLLFIKNGYDNSHLQRLNQFNSNITGPYKDLTDLIKNPVYSSNYISVINKIEIYFYAGDIEAINRVISLMPHDDLKAQRDLALALIFYSKKHRNYNLLTFNGFRLLSLLKLKENLSLIPVEFAEVLYPYAFNECITKESTEYPVKPELILSMMKVESNFNHKALSPAGAAGLMQLMPRTAKEISKKLGILKFELFDPCTSIKFGTDYISWLDRYYKGHIEYIIAAYNGGAGNVNRWIKRPLNRDIDYFSEFTPFDETRDYIFRTKKYIIQYESIYKNR